ncbi:MAG TPA: ABC transporter substrate-binding protein [Stellaceae bacterium]|nr:ABC transporter substrate-binding protein [Stellaceae bacterium]
MTKTGALALGILVLAAYAAQAQISDNVVRIGVLNDQSGVFADSTGPGSVVAAKMAAADFGDKVAGARIEIISADHLNKPDVGSSIAREWFDEKGVDAIADLGNSAVALAVQEVAKTRNKAILLSAGGSTAFTGKACTPITVQWTYDTWASANAIAAPLVKSGKDTWFFITADYTFGHDLESSSRSIVEASGGKVVGDVMHPLNTADFASFVLQAQASKAKVVAFANGGDDTLRGIKQAHEFQLDKSGQVIAGLSALIGDVHALGLEAAQGLFVAEPFYWDLYDQTRKWAERWSKLDGHNRMPGMMQAGVYSVIMDYLRAVAATKSDAGKTVVDEMKKTPVNDPLFGHVSVRPDGRAIHNFYQFQVKSPAESKGPWDHYKLVATVPPDQAFRPMSEGGCPMVASK